MGKEISNRLQQVAELLFEGNQAEMARAMDMTPQGLNPYLVGDRNPGFKLIKRLVELGINATWIVTGVKPMLIKDITHAQVTRIDMVQEDIEGEGEYANKEKKGMDHSDPGNGFFAHINQDDLSETEHDLLVEVRRFSDFLKTTGVPLQVKRLMLELMIEHIDQEIARLRDNQT